MASLYRNVLSCLNLAKNNLSALQADDNEGYPMNVWHQHWANYLKENTDEFKHYSVEEIEEALNGAEMLYADEPQWLRFYAEHLILSLGINNNK